MPVGQHTSGDRFLRGPTVLFLAAVVSSGCAAADDGASQPADLVLVNGRVVTMDPDLPEATALAARGDRIVAVGSDADIEALIGQGTRVVDLEGQLAIPGLIEGHGHYVRFGMVLTQLDLTDAGTWDEIVDRVEAAAQEAGPGTWIEGWGWHQDRWDEPPTPSVEGLPTHERLSRISPDNPVFLGHTSGHGVFVNARALQEAGLTRDTPDPVGGEMVRTFAGELTGMLREDSATPVREALADYKARRPAEAVENEMREHVRLAGAAALANGITSFQDMGSSFEVIDLLKTMADEGNLPVRLFMAIQESAEDLEGRLDEYRMVGHGNGFLTVRTIGEKVLDGALGTHGGWLLEPYTDLPRSVGFNVTPVADIERSAQLAVEHDYQMAIQGIGDRAVRELFDLYEDAWGPDGGTERRWRIEHAQVVHPDDLPRFAELGVIPSIQGIFATSRKSATNGRDVSKSGQKAGHMITVPG